jgi:hypothetical protein
MRLMQLLRSILRYIRLIFPEGSNGSELEKILSIDLLTMEKRGNNKKANRPRYNQSSGGNDYFFASMPSCILIFSISDFRD